MARPITRRTLLMAAALSPVALSAAGAPVRAQDDDVQALLSKAATRMASLTTFHFEMVTVEGRATVLENLEVTKIVGDVLRPASFRATITARLAVVNVDVQIVSVGGSVWVTNPLDGGWEQIASADDLGAQDVTTLINPDQLFLQALELIDEPTIEGTERLGDTDTTVVTGTFDPSRLSQLATPEADAPSQEGEEGDMGMGPMLATEPVYLTAWIDDEGLVHLIEEEGPLTASESDDVIRAITFSAFDEPIEINPPEI